MPFFVTLRAGDGTERVLGDLPFASLEEAYLDACAAIPDAAADELRGRRDPFLCAFVIRAEPDGSVLLEAPFTDLLVPVPRPPATSSPRTACAWSSIEEKVRRAAALRAEARHSRERLALSVLRSKRLIAQSITLARV